MFQSKINYPNSIISSSYDGDLTLTLSSGFKIRIPNSQLVVPDIGISSTGAQTINDTTREVLLNSLQGVNADDIPKLGQTFLTSTYLYVDNEHEQFTLWQSNPTTDRNVIAVGPSAVCSSTTASPTSTLTTQASSADHKSTAVGAIVGGIIGGIAFLSLLALAIFFIFRHKKQGVDQGVYDQPGMPQPLPVGSQTSGMPFVTRKPDGQPQGYQSNYELEGDLSTHELPSAQTWWGQELPS